MSDEEVKADLLEKLKELDRREGDDEEVSGSLRGKFQYYWVKFKIRQAIGHLGLLAFLGIYCIVGGLVSDFDQINLIATYEFGGDVKQIRQNSIPKWPQSANAKPLTP